jgi:dihydrofolate reductase
MTVVSIIVAVSDNGVIGRGGELPWRQRADLRRFKELTAGHTVVMGRKTYESILVRNGRPLPDRRNIVLTRQSDFEALGCEIAGSWQEVKRLTEDEDEIFVIGGAEIYRLAAPHANRLYLTRIHTEIDGDALTFFPRELRWDRSWSNLPGRHPADAENEHEYTFNVYERAVRDPAEFGLEGAR